LSVGAHSPTVLVLVLLVPLGLGGGITVPPMTAALLEAVEPERSGVASGVLNAARQLGGAIGVATFGGLVPDPAHFQSGMRLSLFIGAGVLLTTAVAGALPLRPVAAPVAAGASRVRLRG
jgi:MFS transporter, DHA2 family, methylenomycin A resistance protein